MRIPFQLEIQLIIWLFPYEEGIGAKVAYSTPQSW